MLRRLPLVLVLVALATPPVAGAAGCKRFAHHQSDGGADDYTVVRGKDGGEAWIRLGAGPMPAEFPPGMQFYPGAEVTETSRIAKNVIVGLSTHDPVETVFAFYRKLPGYTALSEPEVKGTHVLRLKHTASGKEAVVLAAVYGTRTTISLSTPRNFP